MGRFVFLQMDVLTIDLGKKLVTFYPRQDFLPHVCIFCMILLWNR